MAYVPDEAIRRRNEVSSGAFALYVHLCMFRCNKRDDENFGLAFPRQQTLVAEMGMNRQHISALTSELVQKAWITKQGWKLRLLLGFRPPVERAVAPAYIEDKCPQNTTFESDNESYAISSTQETPIASRPEFRYQTQRYASQNCQKIPAQLSDSAIELSEFSGPHDRNQQGTNLEPVSETRADEDIRDGDELSDPAVLYWWDICQQRRRDPGYPFKQRLPVDLTIGMASRIAGHITDLGIWRETVDFWSGNDYQLHHVMTILDHYRERLLNKSKLQGANDVSRHDEAKRIREERRRAGSVDGHHRSRSQHLRTA